MRCERFVVQEDSISSACEVVNTFDSFTGRDSRKPSAVYCFRSESMYQIVVRSIRQIAMMAFLGPRRAFIRL